jgi:hypothetical protein
MQQFAIQHFAHRLQQPRVGVADVGDKNGRSKVDPLVAGNVENIMALGAVPYEWQLAVHGARFDAVELLEYGFSAGRGDGSLDQTVCAAHLRNLLGFA